MRWFGERRSATGKIEVSVFSELRSMRNFLVASLAPTQQSFGTFPKLKLRAGLLTMVEKGLLTLRKENSEYRECDCRQKRGSFKCRSAIFFVFCALSLSRPSTQKEFNAFFISFFSIFTQLLLHREVKIRTSNNRKRIGGVKENNAQ